MWVICEDGKEVVNLDRYDSVRINEVEDHCWIEAVRTDWIEGDPSEETSNRLWFGDSESEAREALTHIIGAMRTGQRVLCRMQGRGCSEITS